MMTLTFFGLLLFSALAFSGTIQNFSADMITSTSAGKIVQEGRIFARNGNFRMEVQAPTGHGQMVTIFRPDLQKHWMINASEGKYCEQPFDENAMKNIAGLPDMKTTEQVLGKEKVGGYTCIKKQVTTTMTVMNMTQTVKSIVWQSDEFDMPLKSKSEDGTLMELRNIKKNKPAANLFELPPGCRQVANMMALFSTSNPNANSGGAGSGSSQGQIDFSNLPPEVLESMSPEMLEQLQQMQQ
ncbi:DUF4412 domain-containing protein, partial [Desulfobacterales bacterium HSG17]|nr:DUF4412 domain-containing protein [Desulfobacterales bacterium HSG17]